MIFCGFYNNLQRTDIRLRKLLNHTSVSPFLLFLLPFVFVVYIINHKCAFVNSKQKLFYVFLFFVFFDQVCIKSFCRLYIKKGRPGVPFNSFRDILFGFVRPLLPYKGLRRPFQTALFPICSWGFFPVCKPWRLC